MFIIDPCDLVIRIRPAEHFANKKIHSYTYIAWYNSTTRASGISCDVYYRPMCNFRASCEQNTTPPKKNFFKTYLKNFSVLLIFRKFV